MWSTYKNIFSSPPGDNPSPNSNIGNEIQSKEGVSHTTVPTPQVEPHVSSQEHEKVPVTTDSSTTSSVQGKATSDNNVPAATTAPKKPMFRLVSLNEAAKKLDDMPEPEVFWNGITDTPTINAFVSLAKVGKSSLVEGLAVVAADPNVKEFLGLPIKHKKNVVIINVEEHPVNSIRRVNNIYNAYKQANGITYDFNQNIHVLDFDAAGFYGKKEEREHLIEAIKSYNPDLVIIDSLSKYAGPYPIENSDVANAVTNSLKYLVFTCHCPLILIHHTTKIKSGVHVNMQEIAGSRIFSQDIDNAFSLIKNKEDKNIREIKPIYLKYSAECNDASCFVFDDNQLAHVASNPLFSFVDNKSDVDINMDTMVFYFEENCNVTSGDFLKFVQDNIRLKKTATYEYLIKLENKGIIKKHHGSIESLVCNNHLDTDASENDDHSTDDFNGAVSVPDYNPVIPRPSSSYTPFIDEVSENDPWEAEDEYSENWEHDTHYDNPFD